MTRYESPRYKELGFYVDGRYCRFSGGVYTTDDVAEIAVLDGISDVVKIIEESPEETTPKAPSTRKASAK